MIALQQAAYYQIRILDEISIRSKYDFSVSKKL